MTPGTRLSLDNKTWLSPLPDDSAPDQMEHVTLLVESYVAFDDGEIARMGPNEREDDLELFDCMVLVPQELIAARPADPEARTAWARAIYLDYVAPQVKALREASVAR